mmetsp:Transcript_99688/g.282337  ORF Transcript_99688/g.282337 Transcript_99688/m.282337 type:complete len:674 (+) Transcript_99688:270-2291(+)
MFEAHLPPVLLVLVPARLALDEELLRRVHGMVHRRHVVVEPDHLLRQPWKVAFDDHRGSLGVLRVHLMSWLCVSRLAPWQHLDNARAHEPLKLLRKVEEELALHGLAVASDAGREGREVRRVHPKGIRGDGAPEVAVGPGTDELPHLVEPVGAEVADEAEALDDARHVLELAAALGVQAVVRDALHEVHHVLAAAPGHGQEGHVPDAEAAGARDRALRPVLGRVHGVVLPGVPKAALQEHRLKCPQQHGCGHGHDGLVDEPAAHARARQVLASRHQEHLLAPVLHARPDVFNCERAIAKDRTPAAFEVIEGNVVVHAVADLYVGRVLARVVDDARVEVGAREVVQDVRRDVLRLGVLPALLLHAADVVAVPVRELAHDLDVHDVGPEIYVGDQVVAVAGVLHVRQALVLLRPCAELCGAAELRIGVAPLHPEPDMERRQLRLQFRSLVCLHDPRVSTHAVVAVIHDKIPVSVVRVQERILDAIVAGPYDDGRVRPLVRLWCKGRDAFDGDHTSHFLVVVLNAEGAALLHHKGELLRARHREAGNGALDVPHPRADLHRDCHLLAGAVNLDGDVPEASAVEGLRASARMAAFPKAVAVPLRVEDVEAHGLHLTELLLGLLAYLPTHARGRNAARPLRMIEAHRLRHSGSSGIARAGPPARPPPVLRLLSCWPPG